MILYFECDLRNLFPSEREGLHLMGYILDWLDCFGAQRTRSGLLAGPEGHVVMDNQLKDVFDFLTTTYDTVEKVRGLCESAGLDTGRLPHAEDSKQLWLTLYENSRSGKGVDFDLIVTIATLSYPENPTLAGWHTNRLPVGKVAPTAAFGVTEPRTTIDPKPFKVGEGEDEEEEDDASRRRNDQPDSGPTKTQETPTHGPGSGQRPFPPRLGPPPVRPATVLSQKSADPPGKAPAATGPQAIEIQNNTGQESRLHPPSIDFKPGPRPSERSGNLLTPLKPPFGLGERRDERPSLLPWKWLVMLGLILLGVGVLFVFVYLAAHCSILVKIAVCFFFALGASVILFGVLHSEAFGQTALGIQVGGAVAVFLAVFAALHLAIPREENCEAPRGSVDPQSHPTKPQIGGSSPASDAATDSMQQSKPTDPSIADRREIHGIIFEPDNATPLTRGTVRILGTNVLADTYPINSTHPGSFFFSKIPTSHQYEFEIVFCDDTKVAIKHMDAPQMRLQLPHKSPRCDKVSLEGTISLPDGNPLEKGTIVLLDCKVDQNTFLVEQGQHGRFTFQNVPEQLTYRFQIVLHCPDGKETRFVRQVDAAKFLNIQLAADEADCRRIEGDMDMKDPNPEMVTVVAGLYPLGCQDGDSSCKTSDDPPHLATLRSFRMMKYEVTVADYFQCQSSGACLPAGTSEGCNFGHQERAKHPINCVDWNAAAKYCAWKGMRLPSSDEWEAAARGTGHPNFPWGNEPPSCSWTVMMEDKTQPGCGNRSTAVVGSKPRDRSWCDVMDLGGNVREWVSDNMSSRKPMQASDKVNRGGSWMMSAQHLTPASSRDWDQPHERSRDLGFRCAKDEK